MMIVNLNPNLMVKTIDWFYFLSVTKVVYFKVSGYISGIEPSLNTSLGLRPSKGPKDTKKICTQIGEK